MRRSRLKQLWKQGKTALGVWVTLESPSVTEIATVAGLDWVLIDAEHGSLDFKEIAEHLRVTKHTKTTPLVRVPTVDQGYIKRVLDLGAAGIVVPQIQTAEEVARAIRYAKYPPAGVRGIGAERATHWGMGMKSYTRTANANVLVIPMIETVEAGENFDDIAALDGVDALFFGTCDYAAALGDLGDCGTPRVERTVAALHKKAMAKKIPSGALTMNAKDTKTRMRQGYRMIAVGIDSLLLIAALQQTLAAVGRPVPRRQWDA